MFRRALLSVVIGGFLLVIGGTTACAQGIDYNNWTRDNPTGQPKGVKHRQHQKVQADRPTPEHPDERGWDGRGQDPDKIPFSKDTPDPDDAEDDYQSSGPALIRK
jgi:hypothetical protein